MAVGQAVLSSSSGLGGLQAAGRVLEAAGVDDGRVHARVLRALLELEAEFVAAGMPLSVVPEAALLLRSSQARAGKLLHEAEVLGGLPEAFARWSGGC